MEQTKRNEPINQNVITITEQDLASYKDKGYWISPKLLDDDQIERLKLAHDRIWNGEADGDGYPQYGIVRADPNSVKIRKLDNGWWINNEVRSVVTSPLIGRLASELMEVPEVRLWHDQVILKPGAGADAATQAGNVGWHQDYGYWQCSSTTNMVTVWIALQDTDLTNGGMVSINGSHKWGLIPDSNTFFNQDMDQLKAKYASDGREWVEEPCILKAGQASFHHSLTFHGSGPNFTDQPRRSIVAHLMPGDTYYRKGVQWHPNMHFMGPRPYDGKRFDNEYFPLLYSRG
ncbi:phytanoyl-CoA dioxygenase family protein [Paenibacillus sp. GCM10023252]|uniref:phytanoyl-CoA dioxygenase family protein n=1 Tax=Paenibacillus sp. GCM10023252 TaxID=3252649 RepID=UPI00361098DA